MTETQEMKPLYLKIPADLKAAVDEKAWSLHLTTADFVREALAAAIAKPTPTTPTPEQH